MAASARSTPVQSNVGKKSIVVFVGWERVLKETTRSA